MSCSKCGADNPAGKRFCGDCGAMLSGHAPAPFAASTGERRHLTVLFCDLVGSTEIAAKLDPEEWREVVAGYHRAATEVIIRFGGYVAKYLGDGVMAYFGWPTAHDNDGERATRAGLAILETITKLNHDPTSSELKARVGIDSGTVVVGTGADDDADVFGEAPNIAARVQASAASGTLLITATTHRLVSGLFVVEPLGASALKGITTPLELFQVIRPTGVRGRVRTARGLTPFVGRERELQFLLSRWERTLAGEGQLALIIGEPGIGKSRLVAEFHDHIRNAPHTWMESGGYQFFQSTPLHAIVEMLLQWLELQGAGNTDEQCERLERSLGAAGLITSEAAPLIADLLQLAAGERYPALTLSAEQKRRGLLAALNAWVVGAASVQPLIIVIEDLHWLDPSSLELLQLFAEHGIKAPLMLLYTARPEFHASWPAREHHSQITLNRLSSRDVREMVALVAARDALAKDSMDAVVERTGGVPLFVEELTRAVLETGSGQNTRRTIPATLRDSLTARLDRLGPAKEVIQICAVIGSEFSYKLLHSVHPKSTEDLKQALVDLLEAELLYVRGVGDDAIYQFKHALIRDAAYEALLRSHRRQLHARVAGTLEREFPELANSQPEVIAQHYTEAQLFSAAVPYWQRAGQLAVERSANLEAIDHLTKGIELSSKLPESNERSQQELTLQIMLGGPLVATKGFAAEEVKNTYARARELCRHSVEAPQLFPVLFGLWVYYYVRGEVQIAREMAEQQCLRLARTAQEVALLVEAHLALGATLFHAGELTTALTHIEQSLSLYDSRQHRAHAFLYGQDPGIVSGIYKALLLWHTGLPDQALNALNKALVLAEEQKHPFTSAFALVFAAWLHQSRRDIDAAQTKAETAIAISAEHLFPLWLGMATVLRGWAVAARGSGDNGIQGIHEGWKVYQATGAGLNRSFFLSLLAEACLNGGRIEEGLEALDNAAALIEKNGESDYEIEICRLKGEYLLVEPVRDAATAEHHFRSAIDLARLRNAKSLELRATISLARLLTKQRRRDDARSILAETYNSFTEGFETADLKEAKALIEERSQ